MRPLFFFILVGVILWYMATRVSAPGGSESGPGSPADSTGYLGVNVACVFLAAGSVTPGVILQERDGDRVLPIYLGYPEAQAIHRRLEGIPSERPMTHDLLSSVIETLGGEVVRVVTDLVGNAFHARIDLERDGRRLSVDARPSDSIALALERGAPVFVHPSVMERAGQVDLDPCSEHAGAAGPDPVGCGIWCQPLEAVDPGLPEAFGIDGGVLVADLSPAQAADGVLERGDVILEIAGQPTLTVQRVTELLSGITTGDPIPLRILRGGEPIEVELTCR